MIKLIASLGGNTGAILAGGGMIAALGVGAYVGFGGQGQTAEPVEVASPEVIQPETDTAVAQSTPPDVAAPVAPSFDELRREPDGTVIIAGRAEPMSDVKILVDGEEVGTAKADGTGGFAAIANVPATGAAQVVSLSAQSDADVIASVNEIILAPQTARTSTPVAQEQAVLSEGGAAPAPDAPEQNTPSADQPAVAVLKSDAEGVRLLNAEVSTKVAIDTIGYSEVGDVQLAGRAPSDAKTVRVYLDNRSVISLPVGADGRWRGDLPDVDEGVYTLRVDEVSASGSVSSRVETPFKRESAETLAQATAAADGPIKSITVQTGATLWAIARERYGDGTLYLRVVEANGDSILDPDLIYPGQVFDLPN